ncbi:MAG: tRNA 2-thiouridine(34) synthase MnmA [Clostridia bacterium]|nr:tRNA 2-thiouridine(34) synthase MnmA [Clostridia bacterium]
MSRALIAMSGGVDSSVAAYLTKEAGYDCIGATMRLFTNDDANVSREKSCCSVEDTELARAAAFRLGFPYYVFDFTGDFREKVIEPFIAAYENGRTPNPCINCNRYLKFESLFRRARELGCEYIVTGHYAVIEEKNGRMLLKKAVDETKDQSYVLYSLTQEQLRHTLFPLGGTEKTETRRIAAESGLANADKPDSQDICFVPDGDYAAVLRNYTGRTYPAGEIRDKYGRVLGTHGGIIHYTMGQRKGIGLALPAPVYVTDIIPETNTIVVGPNEDLFTRTLIADDFNWIAFDTPPEKLRARAKIRYKQPEKDAEVSALPDGRVKIVFDEPVRAVTKGQAAVVYDDEGYVLGGGTICAKGDEDA